MTSRTARAVAALGAAALLTTAVAASASAAPPADRNGAFTLSLFHNNDGESQILPEDDGSGGIARFATLLDDLRDEAAATKPRGRQAVLTLSSGDNFLAGPEFNASLDLGTYFDAIGYGLLGYDALTLGNHDFDFGPDVLEGIVEATDPDIPFLSANLDFSAEPGLQGLVDQGRIAPSAVFKEAGQLVGVVGATTERLGQISSPRDVVVGEVLPAVQAEVDRLTAMGVGVIILSSHLQGIDSEIALIAELEDVDIVIAGGGDEDLGEDYPLEVMDAEGEPVYVVTTTGNYGVIGQLTAQFGPDMEITNIVEDRTGLRPVTADIVPDPEVQAQIVDPITEYVASLAETVVATTEVPLNGQRGQYDQATDTIIQPGGRNSEINLGNILADSTLANAREYAAANGLSTPDIAIQNGGGIRNTSLIPAGPVTLLDTYATAPFPNFTSITEDVSREDVKALFENSASRLGGGQFAQVAGMSYSFDYSAACESRVVDLVLDDGTVIVSGGSVVPGPPVTIASNSFLAGGQDGYDEFANYDYVLTGNTYQQTLASYLADLGTVTAADYPVGGEGRVTRVDTPGSGSSC